MLPLIAILLWMILPAALLVSEARSKGYHPAAWMLAGGILGYAILAFLPDTTPLLGRERPDAESRRKLGNGVGVGITIFSILLCLALGLLFSSRAFQPLSPPPPPRPAASFSIGELQTQNGAAGGISSGGHPPGISLMIRYPEERSSGDPARPHS